MGEDDERHEQHDVVVGKKVSDELLPSADSESNRSESRGISQESPSVKKNSSLPKAQSETEVKTEEEREEDTGDEVEETVAVSLFPSRHNMDMSLTTGSTVVPCSLNVAGLQSPMSMTRTPEGQMEWKLNVGRDSVTRSSSVEEPLSPKSNNENMSKSETEAGDNSSDERKFVCHYCDAEFKIRGYLTRHIKKHAIEKAYHCPFFDKNKPAESRCHPTGGFSRRDTYKTHLRSRHFIYPENVKSNDRNKSDGHCAQCTKHFDSTNVWIEKHIESAECEAIPEGFRGTLKNSRRCGKMKMIKTSTGHSRFISTQDSVVEPKVFLNKDALEAMQIVANENSKTASPALEGSKHGPYELKNSNMPPVISSSSASSLELQAQNVQHQPPQFALPQLQPATAELTLNADADEAPLDEFCCSMNYSPVEDAALDSVRSISSQSSHEHTVINKGINFSPETQSEQVPESWLLPLDAEQAGYLVKDDLKLIKETETPKINATLQRQMDEYALGERHFRETQQFLNFFNFTHNYQK